MKITKTSPFTNTTNVMDINVTQEQYLAWLDGTLIQDAMPNISADEREFIMTGITPEEWDSAFNQALSNSPMSDTLTLTFNLGDYYEI